MEQRSRARLAGAGIVLIFLAVQVGGLALVEPFEAGGYQPVEDPENPTNSVVYVGAILVVTAVILGAIKVGLDRALRGFIVLASVGVSLYVFQVAVPAPSGFPAPGGFHALAWIAGAILGIALWLYPEWYVVDAAGVVLGIGAAGLFGITFGIFPAIVLLVALAVYDAISVYGTEHMLTLASGVMEMRVPVVLVVPLSLSYSLFDADLPDPTAEPEPGDGSESALVDDPGAESDDLPGPPTESEPSPLDREALFIGLGDAIVPAILVASAGFFLEGVPTAEVAGLAVALPAATAMLGTIAGLVVLLRMVLSGRAHAGLPLLNGGAIAGYLVGALASGLTIAQALGVDGLL